MISIFFSIAEFARVLANIDLACCITGDFVDDNRVSTNVPVWADPVDGSTVTRPSYEVERLHILDHLSREVALKDAVHVGKVVVRHGEKKPGNAVFFFEGFEKFVQGFFPECREPDAEVSCLVPFAAALSFCSLLFIPLGIELQYRS